MAKGKHPVPFRTRKLSSSAPMVLQGRPCGRVGHRRTYFRAPLGGSERGLVLVAGASTERRGRHTTEGRSPREGVERPSVAVCPGYVRSVRRGRAGAGHTPKV